MVRRLSNKRWVWRSTNWQFLGLLVCIALIATVLISSLSTASAKPVSVRVNRWLQVQQVTGQVAYWHHQSSQPARVGQQLAAVGDGIDTGKHSRATLSVDTGVGTVQVSEQTRLRIQELKIAPDNGRITRLQVLSGQVRLRVRPFTHPGSRLEIQSPAGISGVRGTEFGLSIQPNGKTGLATLKGSVVSRAQGQAVAVNAGYQNLVISGEPPSPPVPLRDDPSLKVKILKEIDSGVFMVRLVGQTDPVNGVTIAGEPQVTDRYGRFDVKLYVPSRPRYSVVVTTPLGKKRVYELSIE